jgi:glycosyltransferase involved in cell wall biosynthesis
VNAPLNVVIWDPVPVIFGGHVVQLDMTAKYVEAVPGVSVRVERGEEPDLCGIDVVHGMGLQTRHIREARILGIPVCLSVVYSAKDYRTGVLVRGDWSETALSRARAASSLALAAVRGGHHRKCEKFNEFTVTMKANFESADLLLPNSQLEADQIIADLNVSTPMRVVPNAVDPGLFSVQTPWNERDGVLYVARLEPHKNQLRLIEALRDTSVRLTIVGPPHPHHPRYAEKVRVAADRAANVDLIDHVPHDELGPLYNAARVHVVPSGFETTGLVSLEAALCGCNVVTTELGYAREYFEDLAWYCRPDDPASIRAAVLAALASPPRDALRTRILERYTWAHTAAATVEAYREVLATRR